MRAMFREREAIIKNKYSLQLLKINPLFNLPYVYSCSGPATPNLITASKFYTKLPNYLSIAEYLLTCR